GWRILGNPTVWVQIRFMRMALRLFSKRRRYAAIGYGNCDVDLSVSKCDLKGHGRCTQSLLEVKKSPEFLTWRYGSHPNLQYQYVQSDMPKCDGHGVAVVRHDRRRGMEGIAIVDQFCESTKDNNAAFFDTLDRCYNIFNGEYSVV